MLDPGYLASLMLADIQELYRDERSGFLRCRLCREGISDEELPCPYRDLSLAYQQEHDLMQLGWPLVLTTAY